MARRRNVRTFHRRPQLGGSVLVADPGEVPAGRHQRTRLPRRPQAVPAAAPAPAAPAASCRAPARSRTRSCRSSVAAAPARTGRGPRRRTSAPRRRTAPSRSPRRPRSRRSPSPSRPRHPRGRRARSRRRGRAGADGRHAQGNGQGARRQHGREPQVPTATSVRTIPAKLHDRQPHRHQQPPQAHPRRQGLASRT